MFDPEKVERFEEEGYGQEGRWVKIRVRASDYDQLLELYREFVPAVPCYVCGKEAKGSKAYVVGSKEPVCMDCWKEA